MSTPITPKQPLQASPRAVLIGLFCTLVFVPIWTAGYMFYIRPPLFQWIMSTLGWSSMRIPIVLHVVVILGVPTGIVVLLSSVRRIFARAKPVHLMGHFVAGVVSLLLAYGLYWAYARIANKKYGTNLDAIQAILYSPDLSGASLGVQIRHYLLRCVFKWPALALVLGGIVQFVLIVRD